MKKGCFIKSVIFITILTAIIIYFVKYHFDDVVMKPVKGWIATGVEEELQNQLSHIQNSAEKDSLISFVKDYISSMKSLDDFKNKNYDRFMESVKFIHTDSVITKSELDSFIYLFKEKFKNEKSTQN